MSQTQLFNFVQNEQICQLYYGAGRANHPVTALTYVDGLVFSGSQEGHVEVTLLELSHLCVCQVLPSFNYRTETFRPYLVAVQLSQDLQPGLFFGLVNVIRQFTGTVLKFVMLLNRVRMNADLLRFSGSTHHSNTRMF